MAAISSFSHCFCFSSSWQLISKAISDMSALSLRDVREFSNMIDSSFLFPWLGLLALFWLRPSKMFLC